jgi:arylsulfatase A-like enzyme
MTLFLALAAPAVAGTNYLVIIADDFGTDKVSSYLDDDPAYRDDPTVLDMPHTPTIDSLATAGARFTQAWANPSCSPTRASLQTGVHAFRHDIGKALNDDQAGLDPAVWGGQLLGTLLADAGYATGYFGKWHLGAPITSCS